MSDTKETEQKKSNTWEWLLWWKVDKSEIDEQVKQYNSLGFFKSARKLSFALLLLSAAITVALIMFGILDSSSIFDAILLSIIGLFIYFGHRWAMIVAMLLWTFEKLYLLINSSTTGTTGNVWIQVIWWSTYMHVFWTAFQVERKRKLLAKV